MWYMAKKLSARNGPPPVGAVGGGVGAVGGWRLVRVDVLRSKGQLYIMHVMRQWVRGSNNIGHLAFITRHGLVNNRQTSAGCHQISRNKTMFDKSRWAVGGLAWVNWRWAVGGWREWVGVRAVLR